VTRAPHQLPRGRHGLPHEYVVLHQRRRILRAVGELMADVGYTDLSIEMILRHSGVSRRTYYDHFADKEAGAMAYFDTVTGALFAAIDSSLSGAAAESMSALDRALNTILALVAEHPIPAQVWLLNFGRSCERLAHRRDLAMAQLARRLTTAETPKRSPIAVEIAIGGVCELLRHRIQRGVNGTDLAAHELIAVLLGSASSANAN